MTPPHPVHISRPAPLVRRMAAIFIDLVVLGAVGIVLGLLFGDQFQRWGPVARLVGFPIALCYLALMNSGVAGGATIGKRILRLRVVTDDGSLLTVAQAGSRALVLVVPWLFMGWSLLQRHSSTLLLASLFGGLLPAQFLLLFFNRPSRQLVHDLLVGSFVVRVGDGTPSSTTQTRFVVLAGVLPIVLTVLLSMGTKAVQSRLVPLLSLRDTLLAETPAIDVSISDNRTMFGGTASTTLAITAWMPPASASDSLATAIARIALRLVPEAHNRDRIAVFMATGYDIMILHSMSSRSYVRSPSDWLR